MSRLDCVSGLNVVPVVPAEAVVRLFVLHVVWESVCWRLLLQSPCARSTGEWLLLLGGSM